jgi:hypothetical protein
MPTPAKEYTYIFCYESGQYFTVDITKKDMETIKNSIITCKTHALISKGAISVSNLMYFLEHKEPVVEIKPTTETVYADPELDRESIEWLRLAREFDSEGGYN